MTMARLSHLYKLLDPEIRRKNVIALARELRGKWWDISRPGMPDPVFVVGCSRSGTTITYETISASPRLLKLGVEIPDFWNALYGPLNNEWHSEAADDTHARPEHRDAAFRYFYQRMGKGRVVDKTCINTMRIPYLHRLFPDASFVFIQRDGRDNISSMIDGWRYGRVDGGFGLTQFFGPFPERIAINNGEFEEWHFFLPPGWRDYSRANLEEVCAFQWMTANQLALDAKRLIPDQNWIHLRYEDIFDSPTQMFQEAFEKLGLPFTAEIRSRCSDLRPTSVVKGAPMKQKWRQRNPEAIERILNKIRPLQKTLGYEA